MGMKCRQSATARFTYEPPGTPNNDVTSLVRASASLAAPATTPEDTRAKADGQALNGHPAIVAYWHPSRPYLPSLGLYPIAKQRVADLG